MANDKNTNPPGPSEPPQVDIDLGCYAHFLDDLSITEPEKTRLLEALWSIVTGFVDLGFRVGFPDSSCGKVSETQASSPAAGDNAVYLNQSTLIENFVSSADTCAQIKETNP